MHKAVSGIVGAAIIRLKPTQTQLVQASHGKNIIRHYILLTLAPLRFPFGQLFHFSQPQMSFLPRFQLQEYLSCEYYAFLPIPRHNMFVKSRSQFVTFVTIIAAQFPVFRSKPELLLQKGLVRNFANLESSISLTFYYHRQVIQELVWSDVTYPHRTAAFWSDC